MLRPTTLADQFPIFFHPNQRESKAYFSASISFLYFLRHFRYLAKGSPPAFYSLIDRLSSLFRPYDPLRSFRKFGGSTVKQRWG
ncbi:hypothetical protein BVC80_887g11 [Macleaya cordata]|uniref:Uncharacterized protein n=1 Tax=Macleaya cordata TaxID=56857 RepID=A0A200RDG3_MACCD|nr:hypothetical protein BVC80_887g11 [Macleaya cordata]